MFSDNFQEDGAVAVQNFIGIAHGLGRSLSQSYVVFIFTSERAKDLVGPSHDRSFTQTAEAFCRVHKQEFGDKIVGVDRKEIGVSEEGIGQSSWLMVLPLAEVVWVGIGGRFPATYPLSLALPDINR